jgi:hypothetical protein
VTRHVLDDPGALSERARRFLVPHTRPQAPTARDDAWYVCTGADDRQVPGPDGGLDRLQRFFARFGGLTFATERPRVGARYRFDPSGTSGWMQVESGDWVAEVGDEEAWPLMLSWSTGRIGLDVLHPEAWIADSAEGLIESAALGQEIHLDGSWREAVPVSGRGPGWGLDVGVDRFTDVVAEVRAASSEWNRWFVDDHMAVHAWRQTYDEERSQVVMAWYRSAEGLRRIEAIVGPLAMD